MAVFGVDIDAVGGWLGSYGGEDSPSDIQRGMFSGEVGTPRLLNLFKKHNLPASWFIPGHSIETFPEQTDAIVAAGHEVMFACKKVAPLSLEDGGVHEHDVSEHGRAAVQA